MLGAPREYLSWSQMLCWEKGPDAYYDQYFLGRRAKSKEMDFGAKIANGLNSKPGKDYAVEFCRTWLPAPAEREKELSITIEGLPLLIKVDGWSGNPRLLDEYKTGKQPWTQSRVDKHGQITFYDLVVWKIIGNIPSNRLWWIPTKEGESGEIDITGELPKCFHTKRSLKELMLMYARAEKAWKGINEFCSKL